MSSYPPNDRFVPDVSFRPDRRSRSAECVLSGPSTPVGVLARPPQRVLAFPRLLHVGQRIHDPDSISGIRYKLGSNLTRARPRAPRVASVRVLQRTARRRRRWQENATYQLGVEARRALDRGRDAHRTRVRLRSTGGVAPLGGPDVTSCDSRVLALSMACLPTVSAVRIGAPVSSRPRYAAAASRPARARWPLPRVLATRSACVVGA